MKKYITISFFIILLLSFFISFSVKASNIKCVDGDTFAIGKTYYRLSYVDTPEKYDPGYKEASEFTCNYIKNNFLILEEKGTDKYGRTLVVVWKLQHHYTDANPGENLNELLIKKCLAEPFYGKSSDTVLRLYKENCVSGADRFHKINEDYRESH